MKNRTTDNVNDKGFKLTKFSARLYLAIVVCVTVTLGAAVNVYASDPLTVVNNLSTFIFGLIRAVGIIILAWGVVQVGMSFQSHDPSQRSQGFLTLAGGLVITFAKEIMTLIGVA